MKKIASLTFYLLLLTISGCGGGNNNLVGTWEESTYKKEYLVFTEDGFMYFEYKDVFETVNPTRFNYVVTENSATEVIFEVTVYNQGNVPVTMQNKAIFETPDQITIESLDHPNVRSNSYTRVK